MNWWCYRVNKARTQPLCHVRLHFFHSPLLWMSLRRFGQRMAWCLCTKVTWSTSCFSEDFLFPWGQWGWPWGLTWPSLPLGQTPQHFPICYFDFFCPSMLALHIYQPDWGYWGKAHEHIGRMEFFFYHSFLASRGCWWWAKHTMTNICTC